MLREVCSSLVGTRQAKLTAYLYSRFCNGASASARHVLPQPSGAAVCDPSKHGEPQTQQRSFPDGRASCAADNVCGSVPLWHMVFAKVRSKRAFLPMPLYKMHATHMHSSPSSRMPPQAAHGLRAPSLAWAVEAVGPGHLIAGPRREPANAVFARSNAQNAVQQGRLQSACRRREGR